MRGVRFYERGHVEFVAGALVFVAVGIWMIGDGVSGHSGSFPELAWRAVPGLVVFAFFGLCLVVFVRRLIASRRRPVLDVSAEGIASPYSRATMARLPWSAVAEIACYEVDASWLRPDARWYLVVVGRGDQPLRPAVDVEAATGTDWYFSTREQVLVAVPLKEISRSVTRERCLALLDRLGRECAPEIARHGVVVDTVTRTYRPAAAASGD